MSPLHLIRLSLPAACLAWLLVSEGGALAAKPKAEAAAQTALKKGEAEYRAKKYAAASGMFEKALQGCGDDQCAPATRGALLRDLGTMKYRQGDTQAAAKSFDDAIAADPDVTFNPAYDKPDVRAVWDDAVKRAADASKKSSAPPETSEPETPAAPEPKPTPSPP
jgi:tetratricopeptide (TPR) repeat protein